MGEIVNLRLARKRAARAEREDRAQANRVFHGLSKSEKSAARQERERAGHELDGKAIAPEPAPPSPLK